MVVLKALRDEVFEGSVIETGTLRGDKHRWLVIADGRIVDPLRWVKEKVDPYVWVGRNTRVYQKTLDTVW
jgi:hypothetical protein